MREHLLDTEDLMQWLGVSRGWVLDHASGRRRPQIPHVKIGRLIRFNATEIQAWLDEQKLRQRKAG